VSQKLTFTKVVLLNVSRKPEGGTIKVSCAPSKTVAKAMEWGEVPEWQTSSTPEGELAASIVEFTPSNSDQAKHAFEIRPAGKVASFEFVRVQEKKGKGANKSPKFRLELHFSIEYADPEGAGKVEHYMQSVKDSTVKITYEPKAKQEELLATDEHRQAALAEND